LAISSRLELDKATLADAEGIHKLVNYYAHHGSLLLPRTLSDIYQHIRDFTVVREDGQVVGCCALRIYWRDLAEIRSLAVEPARTGRGIGSQLLQACVSEATVLGIKRVFTLTYSGPFFERHGFKPIDKKRLPQKIWADCMRCAKLPTCDEKAYILDLKET
jgi:amino-acid N-acetyltransferase